MLNPLKSLAGWTVASFICTGQIQTIGIGTLALGGGGGGGVLI
jgi:hypothetical protein